MKADRRLLQQLRTQADLTGGRPAPVKPPRPSHDVPPGLYRICPQEVPWQELLIARAEAGCIGGLIGISVGALLVTFLRFLP